MFLVLPFLIPFIDLVVLIGILFILYKQHKRIQKLEEELSQK